MFIQIEDPAVADIAELLNQHLEEMRSISPPESKHALDIESLRGPEITFWTIRDQRASLMGCAALKQHSTILGEIKSMRTDPSFRRRGVAGALLEAVLGYAESEGFRRLSLETGSQDHFAPARALYAKYGFRVCQPFADYTDDPNSVFMTRVL